MAPVVVLACGALDRRDDAAGLLAARALVTRGLDGVEVEEVGDLSVDDLLERPLDATIVILDAAVGPSPGEVVRLPFAALPGSRARPRSSHELPIPEMLGLAELLAGRPLQGELIAIGIESAAYGAELSPAVAASMPAFIEAAVAAIREAQGPGAPAPATARNAGARRARRPVVPASPRRRAVRWRRPLGRVR